MGSHLIEIRNLSKSFTSATGERIPALEGIDLDIDEGEFVSVVGPSGCGKSTLLKEISGLLSPDSGSVLIKGSKVTGPVKEVGFVFQAPTLLPWKTVLGNIMVPLELRGEDTRSSKEKAMNLVYLVGLKGFEDKYPFELSGGMQQRVSIARALVYGPKVLLMDEPFQGLDAITREQMGVELLKVWENYRATVVFVTHDISEAVLLSDRVVIMSPRPGKIIGTLNIDLPRPRSLSTTADLRFVKYTQDIRSRLGLVKTT